MTEKQKQAQISKGKQIAEVFRLTKAVDEDMYRIGIEWRTPQQIYLMVRDIFYVFEPRGKDYYCKKYGSNCLECSQFQKIKDEVAFECVLR